MSIDAATAAIIGAIVGGLFSTITALGSIYFYKRFEDRHHRRLLALQMATEHWKRFCADFDKRQPDGTIAAPGMFDVFYFHALRSMEVFDSKRTVTEADILHSSDLLKQSYEKIFRDSTRTPNKSLQATAAAPASCD